VPVKPPLAVTGWSAVSAFGADAQDFREGIVSGRAVPRKTGAGAHAGLNGGDGGVPDFDIRKVLGPKNTRTMDRITGLTVLAVGRLLDGERAAGHELGGTDTGLVLGTTAGSVQSMMDFSRDSFTQDKPYLVDPARFPNAVMNCAAGQSAIWYGLRGPNATVASGQVAGLSALSYAARLCCSRHARSMLCGAVEELTPQRRWLERQRQEDGNHAPLGEGAAMFRLESPADADAGSRPVLAYLVAAAFRVYQDTPDIPGVLADCARAALKIAGAAAEDVRMVAADLTEAQHAGLRDVIGDRPRRVELASALGDTGAASAALQVAAVLCLASADPGVRGRLALVVSADRDGSVGTAVLRLPGGDAHARH
jgi:3-oxoacyl-[acyl-carrier-protein] synthase II